MILEKFYQLVIRRQKKREYNRRYMKEHAEEQRAYQKQWREEHPEYSKQYSKRYREEHPRKKNSGTRPYCMKRRGKAPENF